MAPRRLDTCGGQPHTPRGGSARPTRGKASESTSLPQWTRPGGAPTACCCAPPHRLRERRAYHALPTSWPFLSCRARLPSLPRHPRRSVASITSTQQKRRRAHVHHSTAFSAAGPTRASVLRRLHGDRGSRKAAIVGWCLCCSAEGLRACRRAGPQVRRERARGCCGVLGLWGGDRIRVTRL